MKYIIAAALLLLTACEHTMPPAPVPQMTYSGVPYRLNVATINVVQDYVSPKHAPNVEYLFDLSPAKAMQQWAKTRLIASGMAGSLEVDIKDASVVKKDIPKKETGLTGYFTSEQTEEYDGAMDVTLKIYNGHKVFPIATTEVTAHQMLTLGENATVLDRQALYQQMTVNLMNALDIELNKNIRQYFASYMM